MSASEKNAYNYLAFSDGPWELLAHGRTAALARQAAEVVAPHVIIQVIYAGSFGRVFWDRGVELNLAEIALRRARDAFEQLRPKRRVAKAAQILH